MNTRQGTKRYIFSLPALAVKFFVFFLCGWVFLPPLFPQTGALVPGVYFDTPPLLASYLTAPPEIDSQAALLIDAETGLVLYSKNSGEEIPPASLTKLMTMHVVLKAVDEGGVSLDAMVPIGVESWALRQPPGSSLMYLEPGQRVTLGEIMLGLAVSSGNDAAIAAALYVAPSVSDFVLSMNMEARRMGLVKTRFTEPSGISEYNMTTAAEFASFCRQYLRLHPRVLADYHSVPEFAYPKAENAATSRGRVNTITQTNRNTLLKTFPGVDGFKTGYIDESGYNIALTAQRNGTRFIAVIMGAPSGPSGIRIRDNDAERLLSWAFENFKTIRLTPGPFEPVRLWKGTSKWVTLRMEETDALGPALSTNPADFAPQAAFTAPFDRAVIGGSALVRFNVEVESPLIAPLPASFPVGWLVISDDAGELHRVRLLTAQDYPQGNILKRLWDSIRLFLMKNKSR